jgi:hypothetical protein
MSRRDRQRSFAIAVLIVAAAIAAVSALGGSDDRPRSRSATSTPSPHAHTLPAAPTVGPGEDATTPARDTTTGRARAAAKRLARHFIAAFSRYQAGRLDEATVGRLRALTTPELAAYLLAQPPRARQRRREQPRIARLDLTGPARGRMKAAALLGYGRGPRSLFELALKGTGTRWRVAELYPSAGE